MKDIDLKQLDDAATGRRSVEIVANFDASSCDQQKGVTQSHFVPLPPTETGRRRHDAHQLKAPKFMQDLAGSQQSQHTEMYLG